MLVSCALRGSLNLLVDWQALKVGYGAELGRLLTLQEHQASLDHLVALGQHLLPLPVEDGDRGDNDDDGGDCQVDRDMVVENVVDVVWGAFDLANRGEVLRVRVDAKVDLVLVVVEHGDEVLQEKSAESEEVLVAGDALDANNTKAARWGIDHISAWLKLDLAAGQHNLDRLQAVCKIFALRRRRACECNDFVTTQNLRLYAGSGGQVDITHEVGQVGIVDIAWHLDGVGRRVNLRLHELIIRGNALAIEEHIIDLEGPGVLTRVE